MGKPRHFIIYKPFGMLSQFTREVEGQRTLADLGPFPGDVYPVGRLDRDSEGLLILTNDKRLNQRLLDPAFGHEREYWVQVEGVPTPDALKALEEGVGIRINKKDYRTLPARARLLENIPDLPERDPPVRFRKTVPDRWISLVLTEGKNRQVRRMCAAVGFPVLRLVRVRIGQLRLGSMRVGSVKEVEGSLLMGKLGL